MKKILFWWKNNLLISQVNDLRFAFLKKKIKIVSCNNHKHEWQMGLFVAYTSFASYIGIGTYNFSRSFRFWRHTHSFQVKLQHNLQLALRIDTKINFFSYYDYVFPLYQPSVICLYFFPSFWCFNVNKWMCSFLWIFVELCYVPHCIYKELFFL